MNLPPLEELKSTFENHKKSVQPTEGAKEALPGLLTVLGFAEAYVKEASSLIPEILKGEIRPQVIKHKAADIWGMSITFRESLKRFNQAFSAPSNSGDLKAASAADGSSSGGAKSAAGEAAADLEALRRTAEATLLKIHEFHVGVIGSRSATEQFDFCFKLLKSSGNSKLLSDGLQFIQNIA